MSEERGSGVEQRQNVVWTAPQRYQFPRVTKILSSDLNSVTFELKCDQSEVRDS